MSDELATAVRAYPEGAAWAAEHFDQQARQSTEMAPIYAAYASLIDAHLGGDTDRVRDARAALAAAIDLVGPARLVIERRGRLSAGALTLRGPLQDLMFGLGVELAAAQDDHR